MQNRLFSIFITFTIAPPLVQQLQPRFLNSRRLFTSRERCVPALGMQKSAPDMDNLLTRPHLETPRSTAGSPSHVPQSYRKSPGASSPARSTGAAGIGAFHSRKAPSHPPGAWLWICLFELWYVSFGQAIASFAPNDVLASLLVPVFFIFVVSFSGVVAPYASLP